MIRDRALGRATPIAVLGVLIAVALAGVAEAERPVTVVAGNVELVFNGGFSPSSINRTKLTPARLSFAAAVRTVDESHPPALKEFIVQLDKNSVIDLRGFPVCKSPRLQTYPAVDLRDRCRDAIVGDGTVNFEIAFPQARPYPPKGGNLIIFNGGVKGDVTTLYAGFYIPAPVPVLRLSTVELRKIDTGRFGTEVTIPIPKVAGSNGSLTSLSMRIDKAFNYEGKKVSVVTLKCPDGRALIRSEAIFGDGTELKAGASRACIPKG